MTRKTQILLASHLLALSLGYGVIRKMEAMAAAERLAAPETTKISNRDAHLPSGDGESLLADFLAEQAGKHSKYEELKATLPVAKDLKSAVVSAIDGLGGADWQDRLTETEQAARLAEVEVRVRHWMKVNPVEAVAFVLNDDASEAAGLPPLLNQRVFREVAAEDGVLKSLPWLIRNELTFGTLCTAALDEIRAGGGFELYAKLAASIYRSSSRSEFRAFRSKPLVSANPAYTGRQFLRLVGAATHFREREPLLEMVRRLRGDEERMELLSGFAGSSGEAAEWVLGVLKSGELKRVMAKELLDELDLVVLEVAGVDLEKRLEILRKNPDFLDLPRQALVDELVAGDVRRFLEHGRDWRYEFRNDTATLEEVLRAVREGLPSLPVAGEEALRVTLFRQLAAENPVKALPLLDPFPEEKRRAILFDSTWLSHENVSPDHFMRFLAQVPDAKTPEEQELKLRGWSTKVRGYLWRYGEDYVEWVREMPPGIHREAAINSMIRATSEQHPARARELSEQFYPRNP